MIEDPEILLVEDNPGDIRLIKESFRKIETEVSLISVKNGEKAIELLYDRKNSENHSPPDIVLLDINMPRKNGYSVLEEIRDIPELYKIPTIVLTGSDAEEDINRSYNLCANAYLIKPVDPQEFIQMIEKFEEFWLKSAKIPSTEDHKTWSSSR